MIRYITTAVVTCMVAFALNQGLAQETADHHVAQVDGAGEADAVSREDREDRPPKPRR